MKFKLFLKSNTFYGLLLLIVLYFFACQTSEKNELPELSENNLLATIFVKDKYQIKFFELESKLHIYASKNIPLDESVRLDNLILSEKTNREIYLELAEENAVTDYVDAIEDTDEKNYKRILVINNNFYEDSISYKIE